MWMSHHARRISRSEIYALHNPRAGLRLSRYHPSPRACVGVDNCHDWLHTQLDTRDMAASVHVKRRCRQEHA